MSVCDIPVISGVCDAVGEGVASLVAAPFDWLAQAMGAAAGWLFEAVWSVFDTTTLVDVTGAEYVGVYNLLFGVAIFVMLIFFCLQLITGLIRRDPGALPRAALGLAKSVLGSFVVLTLTGTLLEITDQLCIGIVQATGNSMEDMGDKIALLGGALAGINIAAPGVGAIITIFLAGLAISAAAIVWFSLLVRKALLLVAIVFAPVALAGASWDATRGWFGKWATFVIALILSKLVLVVVFLVAVAQVSQPIDLDLASISDPIAGVVLMLVAAFAPYMTYKFISFVGFDMYHAMSAEQEAKSAMNRPVPVPSGGGNGASPKKILDGGDAPSGGGRPAAPTGAPPSGTGGGSASAGGAGAGAQAGAAAPAGGAAASGGGAGAGAAGGGAAAAGGGAAAAGPIGAAVVVGAKVAGAAATAGPKAGNAVAAAVGGHADAAEPTAPTPAAPPSSPPSAPARPAAPASPPPRQPDPPARPQPPAKKE
ncbi:conjugal transfer protein TrbL [Microbacterium proteolyticum]|uniref:Conjugal transfer protein TrbL n=1 Tax=Microbacterium rhizomatis TaxID=1631477 RepID=A0A5J5J2D6_9MICO|nr:MULTISPECIES: conjugal transfer protein TrbL [Microbacterium]KAA9110357.1 conjugal transfer protein TrbL [Microbacterium rhizomatis]